MFSDHFKQPQQESHKHLDDADEENSEEDMNEEDMVNLERLAIMTKEVRNMNIYWLFIMSNQYMHFKINTKLHKIFFLFIFQVYKPYLSAIRETKDYSKSQESISFSQQAISAQSLSNLPETYNPCSSELCATRHSNFITTNVQIENVDAFEDVDLQEYDHSSEPIDEKTTKLENDSLDNNKVSGELDVASGGKCVEREIKTKENDSLNKVASIDEGDKNANNHSLVIYHEKTPNDTQNKVSKTAKVDRIETPLKKPLKIFRISSLPVKLKLPAYNNNKTYIQQNPLTSCKNTCFCSAY